MFLEALRVILLVTRSTTHLNTCFLETMLILCNIDEIYVQIYILDTGNTTYKENIQFLFPFLLAAFFLVVLSGVSSVDWVAVTVTIGIVTVGAVVTFWISVVIAGALLVSAEIEAATLSLSEASFSETETSCCLSDDAFWLPTNLMIIRKFIECQSKITWVYDDCVVVTVEAAGVSSVFYLV